jgi:hypothetical protein
MTTLTMKDEKRLKIVQRVFQGELAQNKGSGIFFLNTSPPHIFLLRPGNRIVLLQVFRMPLTRLQTVAIKRRLKVER